MEWQKGHTAAMEIVVSARVGYLRICCIAAEDSSYRREVELNAARLGCLDRLSLGIGMTDIQRLHCIQHSLCLLSWSEAEYQSLAILEALACGRPVVARSRGWLMHGPIPGVLVTSSKQQARIWLEELAADASWAADLGKAGREYVENFHALEVVSHHWSELIVKTVRQ